MPRVGRGPWNNYAPAWAARLGTAVGLTFAAAAAASAAAAATQKVVVAGQSVASDSLALAALA
jgi:hypothetical protein